MAPWVFAAPALAFAVSPAIVVEQLGGLEIAFAALLTLVTLTVGFLIQPSVPRIAARVGGASGSLGLALLALGALLVAANVALQSPLLACAAGVLLGGAYGICMLTGLVEVQAMAGRRTSRDSRASTTPSPTSALPSPPSSRHSPRPSA